MTFNELSDEGKLLFVIFATERTANYERILNAYYQSGPPRLSFNEARRGNQLRFPLQPGRSGRSQAESNRAAADRQPDASLRGL